MRKIAVLTSGGDAPGMNPAIRAIVRYGIAQGLEVYGIERGYCGLINGYIKRLDNRSVSGIIQHGGTMLKTDRCPEFIEKEYQQKGIDVLNAYGIEGLIVIGGDGSLRGINDLQQNFNFPCVGIPGTIDNDLSYTDYTLGFDTAVNTVLWAVNNLRDTMTSHERVCIVEVMGRKCGDIAIYAGLAGGAEILLIPEVPVDIEKVSKKIIQNTIKGKKSDIIMLAEGVCDAEELRAELKKRTGTSLRTVKLGHIQRGGTPSMADRVLGAKYAARAVDLLKQDIGGRAVGIKDNKIFDMDIAEALNTPRGYNKELYCLANSLSQ
jgi:6-phosphofructokinase 1